MTPDPEFLYIPRSGIVPVSVPSAIHPFHSVMGFSLGKALNQINRCIKAS